MSKKDFIALADAIRNHNAHVATCNHGTCFCSKFDLSHLDILRAFCQSQNPNFKADRWMDYIAGECGPNGWSSKELTSGVSPCTQARSWQLLGRSVRPATNSVQYCTTK